MIEENILSKIDSMAEELCGLSDYIFDHPEVSGKEYEAMDLLAGFLEKQGFSVERGIGGMDTAFRAVFKNGNGGPNLGLLCEYDALPEIGHACGHHMQSPAIIGAALALKAEAGDRPFTLTIYGTPAEETFGGKIIMLKNGCFSELDVALMCHASPTTTTDVRCMALCSFKIRFHGKSAHAATQPESGRSALDAMLLAFHGIEVLREHVLEDTRMHYTITNGGGADNVVPALAEGTVTLRAYNSAYLETVVERFRNIIKGAELMTGTTAEIIADDPFMSKIPVLGLNELLMKKAALVDAPTIRPPRQKTGSTDFGNVMFHIPGSCIRVAIVPEGTPSHSEEYITAGKSKQCHTALLVAAKVLAASCLELIESPDLLARIRQEFEETKAKMSMGLSQSV